MAAACVFEISIDLVGSKEVVNPVQAVATLQIAVSLCRYLTSPSLDPPFVFNLKMSAK